MKISKVVDISQSGNCINLTIDRSPEFLRISGGCLLIVGLAMAGSYVFGWHTVIQAFSTIGTVSCAIWVLAVMIVKSDGDFIKNYFVEDWRTLERFRIIGVPGEFQIQVQVDDDWVTLRSYGPLYFATQYEAQEYVDRKKQIRQEEEAAKKERQRQLELRQQVVGEFKVEG